MDVLRPLSRSEARIVSPVVLEKIIERLNQVVDAVNGITGTGVREDAIPVVGPSSGLVLPNTIGGQPGLFINYENGVARLATRYGFPATHCVGAVSGNTMVVFSSWTSGPVRLFNDGTGSAFWLGIGGQATLTAPSASMDNTTCQQILGVRISINTVGLVPCQLLIDNYPRFV